MKLKVQAIVLLLLFSVIASGKSASVTTWTLGVSAGDYFYYEMYGVYTSNKPNMTLVIPQFEYNNTDWTRINITSVNGSIIYQIYTLHFKNGNETSFNFKTNVNPANENNLQFYERGVPICAAHLNPGDTIPTAEITINETISRIYASGSRETNHAIWNNSDDWGDCYFDRQTGMLVDLYRTHQFSSNNTDKIVWKTDVIKMIDSSIWEINSQSSPITPLVIVLTVAIFTLLSLVIVTYRLVTRKTRKPFPANRTTNYK